MPETFKVIQNQQPPYNYMFYFDSAPLTQSMAFEAAVQLEHSFAAKILSFVGQYEQPMPQPPPQGLGHVGAGIGIRQNGQSSAGAILDRDPNTQETPLKLSVEIPNVGFSLPESNAPKVDVSGKATRVASPPSTPPPKTNTSPSKVFVHARSDSLASEPGAATVSPFGTSSNGGVQGASRRMSGSSAAQPITTFSPTIWTPVKDRTPGSSRRGSLTRTANDQPEDSPTKGKGKSRGSNATELVRADRLPPRFSTVSDTIQEEDEEHENGVSGGMALNGKDDSWSHSDQQLEREAHMFSTLGI